MKTLTLFVLVNWRYPNIIATLVLSKGFNSNDDARYISCCDLCDSKECATSEDVFSTRAETSFLDFYKIGAVLGFWANTEIPESGLDREFSCPVFLKKSFQYVTYN